MRIARILFPDAAEAAACLAVAMRRRVPAAKALHASRVPLQISKNFVIIMSGGLRPPFCLGRQVRAHDGESLTRLALKQLLPVGAGVLFRRFQHLDGVAQFGGTLVEFFGDGGLHLALH
jgi:hypothetical protein